MSSFLRSNLWNILILAGVITLTVGEYRESARLKILDIQRLEERVEAAERRGFTERERFDMIYMPRELALAQYAEILRRLKNIEDEIANAQRR